MEWVIIIIIVLVLVFIVIYYKNKMKMNGNPINTINYDSCLGFKIGDSRNFVMSRIRHLDLLSAKEKEDIEKHIKYGYGTNRISTSTGKFNNVESISFDFNNKDILKTIFISIEPLQCDKNTMTGILELNIETKIGLPYQKTTENSVWKSGNSIVHLETNPSMYICISNQYYER